MLVYQRVNLPKPHQMVGKIMLQPTQLPTRRFTSSAFTLNLSYVHRIISNPTGTPVRPNSTPKHCCWPRHATLFEKNDKSGWIWQEYAGVFLCFAQEVVEHRPLWPQCVDVARCVLKVLSRKAAACKITSADLGSEARISFSLHGSAFTLSSAFTKEYSFSWLIFTDPWRNHDSLRAHQNLPQKKRLSNHTHPSKTAKIKVRNRKNHEHKQTQPATKGFPCHPPFSASIVAPSAALPADPGGRLWSPGGSNGAVAQTHGRTGWNLKQNGLIRKWPLK